MHEPSTKPEGYARRIENIWVQFPVLQETCGVEGFRLRVYFRVVKDIPGTSLYLAVTQMKQNYNAPCILNEMVVKN